MGHSFNVILDPRWKILSFYNILLLIGQYIDVEYVHTTFPFWTLQKSLMNFTGHMKMIGLGALMSNNNTSCRVASAIKGNAKRYAEAAEAQSPFFYLLENISCYKSYCYNL